MSKETPSHTRLRRPIQGRGIVLATISERDAVYRVRMGNGHVVMAFAPQRTEIHACHPGEEVLVEFSAYNMGQAKILSFQH